MHTKECAAMSHLNVLVISFLQLVEIILKLVVALRIHILHIVKKKME
jgi:hypothetical protein